MCVTVLESKCRESKCRGVFDLLHVSFTEQQQLHDPSSDSSGCNLLQSDSKHGAVNSKRGLHTHKPVNLRTLACFGNMTSAGEETWSNQAANGEH